MPTTRALSLATVIGSDGALNLADVAGLATVAGTGSYTDLTNKPTIPSSVLTFTGDVTGTGTTGTNTALTLANSGVVAGTYNNVTVNSKGLITSGSNTSYLTGNQTVTLSGDASGSGSTAITVTLANSGVVAGTYNNTATSVQPFTVDSKGRLTSVGTAVTITPSWSNITSKPTTLSGFGITDAQTLDADLTAIGALTGTSGFLKKTAANTWSLDTNTYLTGNQTVTLSGDASGSGSTAITVTLANSGVVAGTYNNVTVNSKGLITSGSNTSYLTGNQTVTLSGDASGSGSTAIAVTLATVGASKGGTGQTSYTVGDILYANTTSSLAKLAGVATGNSLISGGVGVAPSWGKIGLTTHVSGTLPVSSGGTGATTLTGLIKGNGTSAFTTVTAPTGAIVGTTDSQTLTNKTFTGYTETVFALSGTAPALSAANGTIQTWTLTGASAPTDSLSAGQSITLMIDDGSAFAITWPSVTWKTNGGVAPTLNTTGYTVVQLWKVSTTLYGARVGDA